MLRGKASAADVEKTMHLSAPPCPPVCGGGDSGCGEVWLGDSQGQLCCGGAIMSPCPRGATSQERLCAGNESDWSDPPPGVNIDLGQ